MNPTELAGRVLLRPGPIGPDGAPTLHNSRTDWLPRLAPGRPAAAWPGLVASLLSLCGAAHRWTAQRAVTLALGQPDAVTPAQCQAHRVATLREQVIRISQDWPALLPKAPPQPHRAVLLRSCPLWREELGIDEQLATLPDWLAQKWLGLPPAQWLRAYEQASDDWVVQWMARSSLPLARLLHSQHAALCALPTPHQPWQPQPEHLPLLATQMTQAGFCLRPHWQASHPDTGPWSRLADPLRRPVRTAWDRLLSRLVEVLRLAVDGGQHWLAHGALALGPGQGLAWVEMARGLLVHRVQLLPDAAAPTLASAQVLAPTEWNVHPEGGLAQALRQLDAHDHEGARRLALSYDPCVAFDTVPETRDA